LPRGSKTTTTEAANGAAKKTTTGVATEFAEKTTTQVVKDVAKKIMTEAAKEVAKKTTTEGEGNREHSALQCMPSSQRDGKGRVRHQLFYMRPSF